jgi:hypothetical protein
MTTALTKRDIQYELAARSFPYFLRFCKLVEPPPGKGVMSFELWPHVEEVANILANNRLVIIMKARQLGISWEVAAFALWTVLYQEGAMVVLFSQGEKEASELLDKCRIIHQLLPSPLQRGIGSDSSVEITFPGMRSKISALSSTEKSGRSKNATLIVWDEADHHDYLDANYAAAKPTVDAGGAIIMLSTVNKKKMGSLFKGIWKAVGRNGFTKVFLGWKCRPGRDEAWYKSTKDSVPSTEQMSPNLYMEQEYPESEEEALRPSRALSAFDVEVLQSMEDDIKEPIRTLGPINIYQKHIVGKRYGAGTDSSHGTGWDDAVTVVIDFQTGYVVADIQANNLSEEDLALQSNIMLAMYQYPLWAIEDNDWGILVIRKAQDLHYPKLFQRESGPVGQVKHSTSRRYGWHTDERSRYVLWGELIEATNARLITVPSKRGLAQFSSVIKNPDNGGKIEAMKGSHDDYPMAVGIAWLLRKEVSTSSVTEIHRFDGTKGGNHGEN